MAFPKVSIITVTYNAAAELDITLENLSRLDYPNKEIVVVDGGSQDATLQVINKHAEAITRWVSESDQGLYYAMNKGIDLSEGEYLWFINAGDYVGSEDVLTRIFSSGEPLADFYYGETMMLSAEGKPLGLRNKPLPEQLTWKDFRRGMVVVHQSVIVSRKAAPYYDTRYRIGADIEWVLLALKNSDRIVNTHQVLSLFRVGGTSSRHRRQGLMERFSIMRRYFGFFPTLFYHAKLLVSYFRMPAYRKAGK